MNYMNVIIDKCSPNSSGMRYYAYAGLGRTLRADTLAGIKALIKEAIKK